MNRTLVGRLVVLVVGLTAIAVVGVAAYNVGMAHASGFHPMMRGTPLRDLGDGMGYWPGIGLVGFAGFVLVAAVVYWLLTRRPSNEPLAAPTPPTAGPTAADLERLTQLASLHTAGKLTDEEFTAAKRKILSLE